MTIPSHTPLICSEYEAFSYIKLVHYIKMKTRDKACFPATLKAIADYFQTMFSRIRKWRLRFAR
jgi:hypothetical protein